MLLEFLRQNSHCIKSFREKTAVEISTLAKGTLLIVVFKCISAILASKI